MTYTTIAVVAIWFFGMMYYAGVLGLRRSTWKRVVFWPVLRPFYALLSRWVD